MYNIYIYVVYTYIKLLHISTCTYLMQDFIKTSELYLVMSIRRY